MGTEEKSNRRTQLIETAEDLFSKKGYVATSMRDIAEALNIEAASLYSHIGSKDDILWEIADRCATEFHTAIDPIHQSGLHTRQN